MWLLSDVTPISDEPILAAELIVVSDEHHEPTDDENEQLSKDHSKNEGMFPMIEGADINLIVIPGTEHYGTAVFDVSVLFKDNRLELIVPSTTDKLGKPHYCTSLISRPVLTVSTWRSAHVGPPGVFKVGGSMSSRVPYPWLLSFLRAAGNNGWRLQVPQNDICQIYSSS
jgi:hypothetical protein